jgi:hypothetical protein
VEKLKGKRERERRKSEIKEYLDLEQRKRGCESERLRFSDETAVK